MWGVGSAYRVDLLTLKKLGKIEVSIYSCGILTTRIEEGWIFKNQYFFDWIYSPWIMPSAKSEIIPDAKEPAHRLEDETDWMTPCCFLAFITIDYCPIVWAENWRPNVILFRRIGNTILTWMGLFWCPEILPREKHCKLGQGLLPVTLAMIVTA